MPIYEYECEKCKLLFEELQTFEDKPLSQCPKCGGPVHRLISAGAGLVFKGTGFYITDYARKGKSGGSDSEKSFSLDKDRTSQTQAQKESSKDKSSSPDKDT